MIAVTQNGQYAYFPTEAFSKVVDSVCDCALVPNRLRQTVSMITKLRWCQFGVLGVIDLRERNNVRTFLVSFGEEYVGLKQGRAGTAAHN